jgi:hypothetical protein
LSASDITGNESTLNLCSIPKGWQRLEPTATMNAPLLSSLRDENRFFGIEYR